MPKPEKPPYQDPSPEEIARIKAALFAAITHATCGTKHAPTDPCPAAGRAVPPQRGVRGRPLLG
jgi:hypothetical protein